MKKLLKDIIEGIYWILAIAILLLLLSPYWLVKYTHRIITGKNRRMRNFLHDEEDGL